MSKCDSSERIRFLRATVEGLEQGRDAQPAPAAAPICSFGQANAPCGLDRALGGLFTGAIYEAAPARMGDAATAAGFALGLCRRFAQNSPGSVIFISDEFSALEAGAPYGPGLAAHGFDLARLLYVRVIGAQDLLWAAEESLRAGVASCVIIDLGSAARRFDLVAARRLTLAARMGGTSAVLLHPPAAFNRPLPQNGARMRFEIRAHRSAEPQASLRPVPGKPHFSLRFAKPGVEAGRLRGLDTETFRTFIWDHIHGCFSDPLSLAVSSLAGSGDRRLRA